MIVTIDRIVEAEPMSRLLSAVDDPVERRTLAPLAAEELVFRLLRSDAAAAMRGALRPGVAMSPSHFAHRFRVVVRMSPMRVVKEVRLDAARTLAAQRRCARL